MIQVDRNLMWRTLRRRYDVFRCIENRILPITEHSQEAYFERISFIEKFQANGPFSYSTKEPGSSVTFIHFYARGSIVWR